VQLEVADRQLLQQPGQLCVTVDLLLPDGTPLLQDLPTELEEVSGQQQCFGVPGACLWHGVRTKLL
jgi:hypothetical protein